MKGSHNPALLADPAACTPHSLHATQLPCKAAAAHAQPHRRQHPNTLLDSIGGKDVCIVGNLYKAGSTDAASQVNDTKRSICLHMAHTLHLTTSQATPCITKARLRHPSTK